MLAILMAALLTQERTVDVRITALDGAITTGWVKLRTFKLRTPYGELTVEPLHLRDIVRQQGKQTFGLSDGTRVAGEADLAELEVETPTGKVRYELVKIAQLEILAPGIVKRDAPPPKASFKNYIFNRAVRLRPHMTADGKWLVYWGDAKPEVVFLELATGTSTAVKVEEDPRAIAEKDGKLYVANFGGKSISIVDIAGKKVTGRIALTQAPTGVAVPKSAAVLYYAHSEMHIEAVELPSGKEKGTLGDKSGGKFFTSAFHLAVSPDNKYLYAQLTFDGSPSCKPVAYEIRGMTVIPLGEGAHADHQLVWIDSKEGRVYGGKQVYSLDLRNVVGKTGCNIAVPHPKLPVVFGGTSTGVYFFQGANLSCMKEDSLAPLKELSVGGPFNGIFPTDTTLYVTMDRKVVLVPIEEIVPAELLDKAKPPSIDTEVKPEAIAKADSLAEEGRKLLDTGKADAALAKFEESRKLDPLGKGSPGAGAALLALKRNEDAIEAMKKSSALPLRDDASRADCFHVLGRAYVATARPDEAIDAYQQGLKTVSGRPAILFDLGECYLAQKKTALAYVAFHFAVQNDSTLAKARTRMTELAREIRKTTAGACPTCKGAGKEETEIEEGGVRKKVTQECTRCAGCGRTWQRPCVDCNTNGCDLCWRRGYTFVTEKDD